MLTAHGVRSWQGQYTRRCCVSWTSYRVSFLGGANFWSREFLGFCWKPQGIFWGFWLLPPFDHPHHLKSGVFPWGNNRHCWHGDIVFSRKSRGKCNGRNLSYLCLWSCYMLSLYVISILCLSTLRKKQKTVKDGPLEKWWGGGGGGWGSFSLHEFFFSKVTLTEKFTCRPCEHMVEFLLWF